MSQRDTSIDQLRGIAIFTMIAANMAAHSLLEPHPLFMRFYGSLAAPLFIFLSGMMVSYTLTHRAHSLSYYLKRGGLVVLTAALIDVFLWKVLPFSTFDVLYVIGIAMPLIYFFQKLRPAFQLSVVLIVIGLAPVLQYVFGYAAYPFELEVFEIASLQEISEVPIWKQLLVDGWFPVFPWLGVSFLGAYIGGLKQHISPEQFQRRLVLAGSALIAIGAALWSIFSPELYTNEGFSEAPKSADLYRMLLTREGYSELFYPPTLYYLALFLGLILLLIPSFKRLQHWSFLKPLEVYGKSSLLVYVLHTVFIVFIFNTLDAYTVWPFIGLYLLHAIVLWGICFGVQVGTRGRKLPFLLRFLLGG